MNRSFTYHNRSCGARFFDLLRHSISPTQTSNILFFTFPLVFSFRLNDSWKHHQIRKVYRFLCFTTTANIKYKRNNRLENNSNKIHSILFCLSFLSITLLFQLLFKEQTQKKLEGRKKREGKEMNCIVWITR